MLDIIGALFAFGMALVAVVQGTFFQGRYNKLERVGLGFTAGPCLMLGMSLFEGPESPFRLWAFTIFMFGSLAFAAGRLRRDYHHWRANELQKEQARQHFERKATR